jgi:hypothetical protein
MKDKYGEYTKMLDVPIGTKFHVVNGNWDGGIVEIDGVKCVDVYGHGCRPICEDDSLVIEILIDKNREDNEECSYDIPY